MTDALVLEQPAIKPQPTGRGVEHLTYPCPACNRTGKRDNGGVCVQCIGWGWVKAADADCIHEWSRGQAIGRCLTLYHCRNCGLKRRIDSSG